MDEERIAERAAEYAVEFKKLGLTNEEIKPLSVYAALREFVGGDFKNFFSGNCPGEETLVLAIMRREGNNIVSVEEKLRNLGFI